MNTNYRAAIGPNDKSPLRSICEMLEKRFRSLCATSTNQQVATAWIPIYRLNPNIGRYVGRSLVIRYIGNTTTDSNYDISIFIVGYCESMLSEQVYNTTFISKTTDKPTHQVLQNYSYCGGGGGHSIWL